MTISASDAAADSQRLERSLELYRDLSLVLSGQIAQLKAATDSRLDGERIDLVLKLYSRALNVAEAEAGLAKRSRAGGGGALDLDAARAEILARLAVWAAEG
jgi:hypothetical protein